MNYSQSLRYLNSFVDLEKLSQLPQNPFFNLRRMDHLLKAAGHPEKEFFPVLVAGTTGKGSTGFFLESILSANGIRTGYYHSPHVVDPRERIRLGGVMVSKALWAEGISAVRRLLRAKPLPKNLGILTYFEALTFLAIRIFAMQKVKVGIFEIGLGGRLDATNVLKAPVVVLTRIHLDHEAFLGNTVAKIAAEKAAIIKRRGHVVTGRQFPEALRVIRGAVRTNKGTLWTARPVTHVRLGLDGDFQKENAGVAAKTAEVLNQYFHFPITAERSEAGLRRRNWMGRMETFRRNGRRFILDGAHNPISMRELVRSLRQQVPRKHRVFAGCANTGCLQDDWLVFGAMNDKNSREMLKGASRFFSKAVLTGIAGLRAKPVAMLLSEAKGLFRTVFAARDVAGALELVNHASAPGATVVVTGSFYLVGEARKILKTK